MKSFSCGSLEITFTDMYSTLVFVDRQERKVLGQVKLPDKLWRLVFKSLHGGTPEED